MKKTLIMITALLLIVGCSKTRNDGELIVKDGLTYDPDTKALYSGKVFRDSIHFSFFIDSCIGFYHCVCCIQVSKIIERLLC